MIYKNQIFVILSLVVAVVILTQCTKDKDQPEEDDPALIAEGKNIFRFDTFGDEDFWSGPHPFKTVLNVLPVIQR